MHIGCLASCSCTRVCYEQSKQIVASTIKGLDRIRRDPEAFQSIAIVARSIIQGFNFYYHTQHLSQLVSVLSFTESFDFYGFCRLPQYFLFPYTVDCLEEDTLIDHLEEVLCDNWQVGAPGENGRNQDPQMRVFAQQCLGYCLNLMEDNELAFHSEKQFKTFLFNHIQQQLIEQSLHEYDPRDLDLQNLTIPLKIRTWLEVLIDSTFVIIDIACIPAFLRDWSFINLSNYAETIGRFTHFSQLPKQSLDDWIWRMMALGYSLQLYQALASLWKGELTTSENQDMKWQLASSAAHTVYCLTILKQKDPRVIVFFAFVAKSLALLRFMSSSKPNFFNNAYVSQ